jgi:deoxyribodipyrimidine photolyase-related protein
MATVTLVFPHQLYRDVSYQKTDTVFLLEDPLYFTEQNFHVQKLILHRASMKFYADYLKSRGVKVQYFEAKEIESTKEFFKRLTKQFKAIQYFETNDYLLEKRIKRYAAENNLPTEKLPSPNFFLQQDEFIQQLDKGKKLFMASFYQKQRKKFKVLVEKDLSPVGGQWSFDGDNRKKLPKNVIPPAIKKCKQNKYVSEAIQYVSQFANTTGCADGFHYPVTFDEADECFEDFLNHRFHLFGDYEDAISTSSDHVYHAVITPALNIGLISPKQIVKSILKTAEKNKIALNNTEGFIRQVLGWREFMRGVYQQIGVEQRTKNYFNFTRKIPYSFWEGTTGIMPVDHTIKKVNRLGYCHHIERLMVLGNFMLLCEFNPDEVYRWFMEMFIDAYDWVMVPNVYGMSQYADGGLMTTKPYVSGSNYILKMSDFNKGEWCEIWDALYWRFLYVNRDVFVKNPRMSMMVNLVSKMDKKKLNTYLMRANNFLSTLKD